jgi:hypothetical protein
MLMEVMMALLSCLAWGPSRGSAATGALEVVARVNRSGEVVATVVAMKSGPAFLLPGGTGSSGTVPEQVLTTTVQDPSHPDEPWVVTTYRRAEESFEAFIKRHREMVEAVREALGG